MKLVIAFENAISNKTKSRANPRAAAIIRQAGLDASLPALAYWYNHCAAETRARFNEAIEQIATDKPSLNARDIVTRAFRRVIRRQRAGVHVLPDGTGTLDVLAAAEGNLREQLETLLTQIDPLCPVCRTTLALPRGNARVWLEEWALALARAVERRQHLSYATWLMLSEPERKQMGRPCSDVPLCWRDVMLTTGPAEEPARTVMAPARRAMRRVSPWARLR